MKVKDLLKALEGVDPELDVVVAADAEGNGYSSLFLAEETMVDEDGRALHPDDYEEYGVNKAFLVSP